MQPQTLPVNKCYSSAWPQSYLSVEMVTTYKGVYICNIELSFFVCRCLEQDHYYYFVDLPLLNMTELVKTSRMFVCI